MTNRGAMMWGVKGLYLLAGLALGLGFTTGCGDDDGVPATGAAGGADAGGEGGAGATAGKAVGQGGAGAGVGGAGASGEASCDCGMDVNAAMIPLGCACDAGLCTTFAEDLATYQRG